MQTFISCAHIYIDLCFPVHINAHRPTQHKIAQIHAFYVYFCDFIQNDYDFVLPTRAGLYKAGEAPQQRKRAEWDAYE